MKREVEILSVGRSLTQIPGCWVVKYLVNGHKRYARIEADTELAAAARIMFWDGKSVGPREYIGEAEHE